MISVMQHLALIWGIQVVGWAISSALQTEKFYDVTAACTYILVTVVALQSVEATSWRHQVIAGAELLWALRLGLFLFSRVLSHEDVRFRKVKVRPMLFLVYWLMQALWITLTNLPVMLVLSTVRVTTATVPASPFELFALLLFVVGLVFEAVADWQKTVFKSDPQNAGRFIADGLWSVSRHPNYFGEVLLHIGITLFAFVNLLEYGNIAYAALVTPLFVTWLLTRVSGVPLLEKLADKRWGGEKAYQVYKQQTAVFIPFLW
eukprot:TRINITY_DN964_c0_g1_i2.p1 TRINITY_DN964_c0_g1~~TRINITY_DN964_c0_g1_i2.p1  ORF type:complete len:261 (-),score=59.90 TRINITY_DN964_c0_g1_i2:45-827(-)